MKSPSGPISQMMVLGAVLWRCCFRGFALGSRLAMSFKAFVLWDVSRKSFRDWMGATSGSQRLPDCLQASMAIERQRSIRFS